MITWATDGQGNCAVFCHHCRSIFIEGISPVEANESKAEINNTHHCIPTPPWRPGDTKCSHFSTSPSQHFS